MPFDKKSALKHKKGLSESEQSKWASIANSVRSACLKKGSRESFCDGKAIRIANSQVGKKSKRVT